MNLINIESGAILVRLRHNFSVNPQDSSFNVPIQVSALPFTIGFQIVDQGGDLYGGLSYLVCEKMSLP